MRYKINITDKIAELVDKMLVRELLNTISCNHATANNFKSLGNYGSFFFHPTEKKELEKKVGMLKDMCTFPPFITSDFEHGPGKMIIGGTQFPSFMSFGIIDDESITYEVGKIAALEGRKMGYNWTLSPCADLFENPDNPSTSIRAASSDTEVVSRTCRAYIRGLQENGMMATAKHFPGDGFDVYDQHITTPENPQSRDEWLATSGKVFQDCIDDGLMAIMPGHIAFPAFDIEDPYFGLCPPASASKRIMTDLLKEQMDFDGIIVSDAINMAGIVGYMNFFDAAAKFWEAGGDILLFITMDEMFYIEMEKRIDNGTLKIETLKNRACRVMSVKKQMGILDNKIKDIKFDRNAHQKLSAEIVDKSLRVIRDRNNTIPFNIQPDKKILHLIISSGNAQEPFDCQKLTGELEKVSNNVTEIINPRHGVGIFNDVYAEKYDLIICSVTAPYGFGTNVIRLHGPNTRTLMQGWMRLGTPAIFIAHDHPAIHLDYKYLIDTVINTYGSIDETYPKLVQLIMEKK